MIFEGSSKLLTGLASDSLILGFPIFQDNPQTALWTKGEFFTATLLGGRTQERRVGYCLDGRTTFLDDAFLQARSLDGPGLLSTLRLR